MPKLEKNIYPVEISDETINKRKCTGKDEDG